MYFCTAKNMEQFISQLSVSFPANLIVNYNCLCGYFNENAEHYLLHCNRFTLSRIIMLFEINKLNLIGIPVNAFISHSRVQYTEKAVTYRIILRISPPSIKYLLKF
jgi:hypothetical protein